MRIPLPKILRHWRERAIDAGIGPAAPRAGISLWAWLARRPALYHALTGLTAPLLAAFAGKRGRFSKLPLAGGWTGARDFPAPEGQSFHSQWRRRRAGGGRT